MQKTIKKYICCFYIGIPVEKLNFQAVIKSAASAASSTAWGAPRRHSKALNAGFVFSRNMLERCYKYLVQGGFFTPRRAGYQY